MPKHPGGRPFDEAGWKSAGVLLTVRGTVLPTLRAMHERTPRALVEPAAIRDAWLALHDPDAPLAHEAELEIRYKHATDDGRFRRALQRARRTEAWRFIEPDPDNPETALLFAMHVAEYRTRPKGGPDLAAHASRLAVALQETRVDRPSDLTLARSKAEAARKRLADVVRGLRGEPRR